ncbi:MULTISPECIES: twin-arginine translocase subunit TatC [Marichromatium]|uniref:Sec-independent protein translocase protein TatC n=1 Tax=Marichromatium gracile TaxID=1048 RepID=A0A4R4AK56_MARGR|nr:MULTISPECIES: twin-arginine translocase subunit TatC [Marichromatium]MBO8086700.1 twin-arginine translocase subunit TatC [Marichromatium sp.]TCW39793.1 sec-independent protein translocase protein TatC [Marichromatium gracile]
MSPAMQPDDPGAEQPFVSHLIELRDRLIRMVIAILVVFLALFPFANELYVYIAAPLMAQLPDGNTMIATQVAAPFLTPFKLALVAAVFLSMPFLFYQLWAFVAPGLYQHERRLAVPLLLSSVLLFYLGMLFAYYVVFPLVFAFLAGSTPEGVAMMTDISAYLDFVLTLFFAFGLAFEIPIATILLVALRLTTPAALAAKRPYVIVGVFIVGMFLTPPDVISQTLLAIPMWLLFELGILFARILLKGRLDEDEDDDGTDPDGPGGSPAPGSDPRPGTSVGGELDPALDEASRWQPLSETEMEAELDRIDAEEAAREMPASAPVSGGINSVEEKLKRANRLRELDSLIAARHVLYEVLEEGDEDARRVARNILAQLDD